MTSYNQTASAVVRAFMLERGVSADALARRLSLSRGTFYARLEGARPWRVSELETLALLGVKFPPFVVQVKPAKRGKGGRA